MLPVGELVGAEVGTLVLGEAEQEHRPVATPIGNDGAKAAALALPRPGNALLDEPAAQIGIDAASALSAIRSRRWKRAKAFSL